MNRMGSLNNMIRQATGADEEEQRAKERMELLLVAAKTKIESFRNQLDAGFTKLSYPHYGIDTFTEAMPMRPAARSNVEAYLDEMVRVWKKLESDR